VLLTRDFRVVVWACSTLALVPLAAIGQSKRIAVYDFGYKAVRSDVVHVYGNDKDVGAQAASRIISKLVGKGSVEVIDRSQIDNLMKEQNLKFSDRFDPRDAPKLGKLLNVDAIITGSVDAISDELQNNRVGVGPVGFGKVQSVAEVTISIRVISTQTAQIFLAEQVNNKQKHNLGQGAKVGKSGSDGGSASLHPGAMAVNLAIQGAADEIAAKILARADALPSRTGSATASKGSTPDNGSSGRGSSPGGNPPPPVSGRPPDSVSMHVGKVDGTKVYLTSGENAGIKVNDYFEVRRATGSMKDPQGNEIEMDERVETVVVTDVQDKYSVAKTTSGSATAAKVGDKLKRAKAAAAPKKAAPAAGAPGLPAPVQRKQ
jgi:curli biogenesis system outer membrane secretion channel CsgG